MTLLLAFLSSAACTTEPPSDGVVGERSAAIQSGDPRCSAIAVGQLMCDDSWWDPYTECVCVDLLIYIASKGQELPEGTYDECYQLIYSQQERDCERFREAQALEKRLCQSGYADPDSCPESWRPNPGGDEDESPSSSDAEGGRAGSSRDSTPGVKRPSRM